MTTQTHNATHATRNASSTRVAQNEVNIMTNAKIEFTKNNVTYDVRALFDALKSQNDKTFTIAQLSRAMKLNEKQSRRKLRANASRAKNDQSKLSRIVKSQNANTKYTYDLTIDNVDVMSRFIA